MCLEGTHPFTGRAGYRALAQLLFAAREGRSPEAVAYDQLLANDGKAFLYSPLFSCNAGNYDVAREIE